MRISGLSRFSSAGLVARLLQAGPLGLQIGQHLLLVGPIAVMHAVVAGQVARGLAGGDDVVDGHRVLAVRHREPRDLRAQRLVDANRLADRRVDLRIQPLAEMLANHAQPQAGQRLPHGLGIRRHGQIHGSRVGRRRDRRGPPRARPCLRPSGPAGRSGPDCWRRPPAHSGSRGRRSASARRRRTAPRGSGPSRRCRCRPKAGPSARPRRPPPRRWNRPESAIKSQGLCVG